MKRLVTPLGPLFAGLLGVLFGRSFLDGSIGLVALVTGIVTLLILLLYATGKAALRHYPAAGAYLMESGAAFVLLAGAVGGGVIFWAMVKLAAGKNASPLEKETLAGISGAVTTYIGAAFGKSDLPWNPVKAALRATFGGCFTQRRDHIEKDAHDAIQLEEYGSMGGGA